VTYVVIKDLCLLCVALEKYTQTKEVSERNNPLYSGYSVIPEDTWKRISIDL
jgi:hypothetical protein